MFVCLKNVQKEINQKFLYSRVVRYINTAQWFLTVHFNLKPLQSVQIMFFEKPCNCVLIKIEALTNVV